jgi:hypothetical protein
MVTRIALLASLAGLLACVTERERSRPLAAPQLTMVGPEVVVTGQPFNVQPDGSSALYLVGQNLFRGSAARWNGELLETTHGGDGAALGAVVPRRLTAQPGVYTVTVEQAGGSISNGLPITVLPAAGPAPSIAYLHPDSTRAGELFSPQPGGAALAITGAGFRPGMSVLFGAVKLPAVVGNTGRLSVLLPPGLLARPGEVEVVLENPDGKRSAPARFKVI